MLNSNNYKKLPIYYLEKPRWNAVRNYLIQGKTAENIIGEIVLGNPLTAEEVSYVETKLHQRGVYL